MSDPTDRELLEWIARFAGWGPVEYTTLRKPMEGSSGRLIPDYLNSVDCFLRDVWPKVEAMGENFADTWEELVEGVLFESGGPYWKINASAKVRCLALYRACEGKLP